jgi:hypothetical protein
LLPQLDRERKNNNKITFKTSPLPELRKVRVPVRSHKEPIIKLEDWRKNLNSVTADVGDPSHFGADPYL